MTATTAPRHLAAGDEVPTAPEHSVMGRLLDVIERAGNKVPHPVTMFLYLIIAVIVLSAVLAAAGVSVTDQIAVPDPVGVPPNYYEDSTQPILEPPVPAFDFEDDFHLEEATIPIKSLLDSDGIRFIFTSFVPNFAGFGVVAVTFIALMGAGVAERSGLMGALIRLLVSASPRRLLAFVLIFVGVLSSIATDAGYLILVPLGAAAFLSVGRHPLAGLAACFAGVGSIFGVNPIPGPIDAQIIAITNEAIATVGGTPLTILADYWFSLASSIVLAIVAAVVTERVIEPRLGRFHEEVADVGGAKPEETQNPQRTRRGLRSALVAFLGFIALVLVFTIPNGAPLRDPETAQIIGNTPFMDSVLFIIAMAFLVSGVAFGYGTGSFRSSNDVIDAVTTTFAGLAGLIFMLLMISQFIAYFNYSNLPTVLAIMLAEFLEAAGIGALPLLLGMIIVILSVDVIMPGIVPAWAIFAPILVPLFIQLGVAPQTGLAAYRIGDSPLNTVTPLMVYLPFMVTFARRYQKDAGMGTIIALMIPYVVTLALVWIILFIIWFMLGLPMGPGYPVAL
jgi:aminobenzoyl-glutamate transport protein